MSALLNFELFFWSVHFFFSWRLHLLPSPYFLIVFFFTPKIKTWTLMRKYAWRGRPCSDWIQWKKKMDREASNWLPSNHFSVGGTSDHCRDICESLLSGSKCFYIPHHVWLIIFVLICEEKIAALWNECAHENLIFIFED